MKVVYQVTVDFSEYQVSNSLHKSSKEAYINGHKIVDVQVTSGTVPAGIHCQVRGDKSSLFWTYAKPEQTTAPAQQLPAGIDPQMFAAFQAFMAMQQGVPTAPAPAPAQPAPAPAPAPATSAADELFAKWQLSPEAVQQVKQFAAMAKTASDDKQLRNTVATLIKCFSNSRLSDPAWSTLKANV